ncbi:cytochrome b [Pseudoalteromonas sp. Scap03]|uniref:cytochrome b n=1 Tax=unclassified Pseudoalteromonas TaxID=194690 RepID=UPI0015C1C482|nr:MULTISPECIES: cytochrome b [unclassified Pseudoalteromonas]NWL16493.1 cytochrome b [Pseudoalteromonas sp. Scap03]QLE81605.1 cytochrome b [Pseudoalteromonas sp. Scap25]QLE89549.1 cytochrome b [Pseudoalteromonas sp. Scap06]
MFKNSKTGYGLMAIFLHWLMALTVFGLFGLGLYMVELTYYDSWYKGSLDLHKSIGLSLAAVFVFRLLWRRFNVKPSPIGTNTQLNQLAQTAHILMYLFLVIIMVSGYLISTADGRPIEVFGLFYVKAIDFTFDSQADIAGQIHYYSACLLIGFVVLHILGVLKHHFIDKDKTLIRMIKLQKEA